MISDTATAEAMLLQRLVAHKTNNSAHTASKPDDADSEVSLNSTSSKLRTSRKRYLVLSLALLVSTLVVLLAMAYLSYMWLGNHTNMLWKLVILSDWITTTVAICGFVIRRMSDIQMGLCTSILALELLRSTAPIQDVPRLSTSYHNNSGRFDLIHTTFIWPSKAIYVYTLGLVALTYLRVTLLHFSLVGCWFQV